MSIKRQRHVRLGNVGVVDLVAQPWWIDLLTGGLVLAWMAWTFATIQQYGPSPALVGGSVVVLVIGVLAIHGQYVSYFRLGNYLEIGRDPPAGSDRGERGNDD